MSALKSWYYGRQRVGSESDSKDINNKKSESDANEEVMLPNMSELSRAAAAGKAVAGEHFADMALGEGFGALVDFDSSLPPTTTASTTEEGGEVSESPNTCENRTSEAATTETQGEAVNDFLPSMTMGDTFGAIMLDETQAAVVVANEAEAGHVTERKKSTEDMDTSNVGGALYPEVERQLGYGAAIDDGKKEASVVKNDNKRPTLYQRMDRYLFPPSKLIVDCTLVPSNSTTKSCKLEVEFPRDRRHQKRDRRLIGTGLGSVAVAAVGVVSRRASQDTVSEASTVPPTPPTLRSNQVLLWGATTVDAHYQRIRHVLETARGMHGADGLRAVGFEYRMVPCQLHSVCQDEEGETTTDMEGRVMQFMRKSASHIDDDIPKPEQVERARSQSDAGVPYDSLHHVDDDAKCIPCSSPSSHDHHQMIIVSIACTQCWRYC